MKSRSPMEKFKLACKIFIGVIALMLVLGFAGCHENGKHTNKYSHDVTLVDAYSSMQNCGHKGRYSCEVFTGRFVDSEGRTFDREMDGFFYHRYLEQGRKDIVGASITVTDYNLGYKSPKYVVIFMIIGFLGLVSLVIGVITYPFIEMDVDDSQREWERLGNRRE